MDIPKYVSRHKPFFMIGTGLATGLAWPLLHQHSLWLPGLFISVLGLGDYLFPRQIAPLFRFLESAGKAVAHYNGIVLLSLVYVLIIAPAGIFFQLIRRPKPSSCSPYSFYEKPDSRDSDHMRRMF